MRWVLFAASAGLVAALGFAGAVSGETSPELLRGQAAMLIESAANLLTQGNTKDALAAAKQARGILQNLATANPDSTDCQFDLAVGDIKIGYVLEAQGDLAGALNAYRESQVITTALTQKDPNSTLRQNALALSDMRIGDVLRSYRQILVTA